VKDKQGGSLLGRAGPLVLARFFTAGLTISIPLVLARVMNLEEYGTYKQLFLIAQTLYYVLPFGVPQSLYFFVPRAEEKRPWFGQTLLFLSAIGALAAAALWSFGEPVAAYFKNPALLEYRTPLAIYTWCLLASFPLEISLTSQGKTKLSALSYLISDTSRAALMVVPVLLGWGLSGMMKALAVYAALRYAAAWIVTMKGNRGRLFDPKGFLTQLAYAAPFGAAMALAIPQQYAHQYAVSGIVSPELFALYAVGCFQLPVVDLLYTPTSEVLMVQLGELDKAGRMREAVAAFRDAASKLAFAFFPMAAFLFAAAPEFIAAMFGPRFLPAVPLFRVSVVGVVLAVLPMDGVLRARGHTRHIFLSYLVKAAVTVPLVYFGVTRFGMMGGIASWAIAEAVGKLTLLVKVPQALSPEGERVRLSDCVPWAAFGKASMAAAASALAVFVLRVASERAWVGLPPGFLWRALPLAIAGVLFAVGYLTVLWFTGVRPTQMLAVLRRRRAAA
jgi:O-antigen/teichoic acid export membrane protein